MPHPDLDSLDKALIDRIFAVNVRGVSAMTRGMRPLLERCDTALIVNISSVAAVTASVSNIACSASTAAVDSLTKSLARAIAPRIRVVSISPAPVDTEFVKRLDQARRDIQARQTPLGCLGLPEDVADAVVASATALRFTTGSVISIDGGCPLGRLSVRMP